jgi:hypothetical protein
MQEGMGYPLAAQALRKRAAELRGTQPAPQPPAQPQPAPQQPAPSGPALDANMPAYQQQAVRELLQRVTDPATLDGAAAVQDAMGYPIAAQALRKRAAELRGGASPAPQAPPAQPQLPQQPPPTQGQPSQGQSPWPTLPGLPQMPGGFPQLPGLPQLPNMGQPAPAPQPPNMGQPAPAPQPPNMGQPAPAPSTPPPPATPQPKQSAPPPPGNAMPAQPPLDAHLSAEQQATLRDYIRFEWRPEVLDKLADTYQNGGWPLAAQAMRARAAELRSPPAPAPSAPPAPPSPAPSPPVLYPMPPGQPPLDQHLTAEQQEMLRDYIESETRPWALESLAANYDALGYPLTAQAMRARAAELRYVSPYDPPRTHTTGYSPPNAGDGSGDSMLPVLALVGATLAFS